MNEIFSGEIPEKQVLKPHLLSYFFVRGGIAFFLFLLFLGGIISMLALTLDTAGIIFLIIGLFFTFYFFALWVSYKKEEYILYPHKAVRKYGTIFSSNSVELQFPRTVILMQKKPWLLRILFGTGNITLKAAGSNQTKFKMLYQKDSDALYDRLQEYLQKNTFHLEKKRLVQEARPHILGIFAELLNKSFGVLIFGFYIVFASIQGMRNGFGDLTSELPEDIPAGTSFSLKFGFFFLIIFLIVLLGLIITFSYLDLRRRRYDIYDDAVEYREGFLTHHKSIIPMEAVSDVENTQGFFSRIFGLHDVKISCAGTGNDVLFKNMVEGEKMIANIRYLKDAISPKKQSLQAETPNEYHKTQEVGYIDKNDEALEYDREFQASYHMDMKKTLLPACILLIPPFTAFGIFVLIGLFIRAKFTKYSVAETSVEYKFDFFVNRFSSFNIEKITGVTFRESLLDKIFGTCSVVFMSIGNSKDIVFSNIKKEQALKAHIKQKIGVFEQTPYTLIDAQFTLMNFIKAHLRESLGTLLFMTIFPLTSIVAYAAISYSNTPLEEIYWFVLAPLFIGAIILLILGLIFLYAKFLYSPRFYKNAISSEGVKSQKGIIIQTDSYALSRNIKGLTSVKYPFTKVGKLIFNIAGEQFIQTGKGKGQGFLRSYTIGMPYIADIFTLHETIDADMLGRELNTQIQKDSRQALLNTLLLPTIFLGAIILGAFFLDLVFGGFTLVLLGCIWGWIFWSVRVKYYVLEVERIRAEKGIIYKVRSTILYNRFNFIELNRGFFNTLFRNGSIAIYTLGSGKKDMKIQDIDHYQEWYDILEKY